MKKLKNFELQRTYVNCEYFYIPDNGLYIVTFAECEQMRYFVSLDAHAVMQNLLFISLNLQFCYAEADVINPVPFLTLPFLTVPFFPKTAPF